MNDPIFMARCMQLADSGLGTTAPNPLVGSVIVHSGKIIGEGFHRHAGQAHAEVMAIRSVSDHSLLGHSTLYVNLEPCAHFGKTPPCADLILEKQIPRIVISNTDPNPLVAGKGIHRLAEAGREVITGVLEGEGLFTNRRFFTFHQKKRPYVILKWAQSSDGFMDIERPNNEPGSFPISGVATKRLVHLWRSQEPAILIGGRTACIDNPSLTVREIAGRNPLRVIVQGKDTLPNDLRIFDGEARTLILATEITPVPENADCVALPHSPIKWMEELYKRNIQSVLVEGGARIHNIFLDHGLWDEIRIIRSPVILGRGLRAPEINQPADDYLDCGDDRIHILFNRTFGHYLPRNCGYAGAHLPPQP